MTVKELSQLYHLNRKIELDKERLAELEAQAAAIGGGGLDGMPRTPGYANKVERLVAEIVDTKGIIAAKQTECIFERNRLERYIADIPDALTQNIFALRFVNGLTWFQVAQAIGGNNTEDSVKKTCYRYLDKEKAEAEQGCPECPASM